MKKEKSKTAKSVWRAIWLAALAAAICVGSFFAGYFVQNGRGDNLSLKGGMATSTVTSSGELELDIVPLSRTDFAAYGIAETADSAMTVTASFSPASTTKKEVIWSEAFRNSESEWARGKIPENYVTYTTSVSNPLQIIVTCSEAFGEPIEIKAEWTQNSDVSCTCEIEYVAAPVLTFGQGKMHGQEFEVSTTAEIVFNQMNQLNVKVEYGVGTVYGELTYSDLSMKMSDTVWNAVANAMGGYGGFYSFKSYEFADFDGSFMFQVPAAETAFLKVTASNQEEYIRKFKAGFVSAVKSSSYGEGTFTVSYTYSYEGDQFGAGELTCDINFSDYGIEVEADEVTLDRNRLIFGRKQ